MTRNAFIKLCDSTPKAHLKFEGDFKSEKKEEIKNQKQI